MFDDIKNPVNRSDCRISNPTIIKTIPHFVLKFQLNGACLKRRKASASFGGKLDLEEQRKEKKKKKKKRRESVYISNADAIK